MLAVAGVSFRLTLADGAVTIGTFCVLLECDSVIDAAFIGSEVSTSITTGFPVLIDTYTAEMSVGGAMLLDS